jgi:RNA polymerase sigma factor (sigma-70 family)
MCVRDLDEPGARNAWAEFYNRHYEYLYRVCRRAYCKILGEDRVCDLVQDTFLRVFQRACSFKEKHGLDLEGKRRLARAWLGMVSEHVFSDYFRNQPLVDFMDAESFPDPTDGSVEPCGEPPTSLLDEALEILTDREQQVLRATALWYKPGERHQRLPNSVMEQLATELGTNSANIRQVRVRAIAKVKAFIDSRGAGPESE